MTVGSDRSGSGERALRRPAGAGGADAGAQTLLLFDASRGEDPEGVAVDASGNAYVSLLSSGRIVRLSPDGRSEDFARVRAGARGASVVASVGRRGE